MTISMSLCQPNVRKVRQEAAVVNLHFWMTLCIHAAAGAAITGIGRREATQDLP
jgi:hypothetical protein